MTAGFSLVRNGLICGLCLMGAAAWAGAVTPYVPDSADVVLQRVPSSTDPRVRKVDELRQQDNGFAEDVDLLRRMLEG